MEWLKVKALSSNPSTVKKKKKKKKSHPRLLMLQMAWDTQQGCC
jgi:hypothetical protein